VGLGIPEAYAGTHLDERHMGANLYRTDDDLADILADFMRADQSIECGAGQKNLMNSMPLPSQPRTASRIVITLRRARIIARASPTLHIRRAEVMR